MFPNEGDFEAKFTLESEKSGVVEELPFHILVFGDWSGDGAKKDLSYRKPIEIDRDNFDEVLQKLNVSLNLELTNNSHISLTFEELDDFHPDNIYRQVSLFSDLRDLRRRLTSSKTFHSAAREVRSWREESVSNSIQDDSQSTQVKSSENILDQILSGESTIHKSQMSEKSELGGLISNLVQPFLVSFDENEQSDLISAVDNATSALMRQILHNSKFQELEASWRGLYFLVRNTDTDLDLKLFILDVSKDELSYNLKSVSSLQDSMLYRWMLSDKAEKFGEDSWSVFCGNYSFSPTIDDIALLIRLSNLASYANAPFISHIRPEIFGVKSLHDKSNLSDWNFSSDSQESKLWSAIRTLPESEYLGLTIPRFLSRLPFGSSTEPLDSFAFEEFSDIPIHDQYLWSNSAFLCTLLLAQSFRSFGWQMGNSLLQDLSDLPTHIYKLDGETITKPCAEVVFTQNSCEKLMEYGLMTMLSFKNTDRVRLARFQSITGPVSALKGKWS